jgi:hypothetical protein
MYEGWVEATKTGDAYKNSICWNILRPLTLSQLTNF